LLPSYEIARQDLAARGTPLDIKVVHGIARKLGAAVLTRRTRDLEDWRAGKVAAGRELAGKRVAVMIDGGRTRIRKVTRKQKGRGKKKKQRRRYQTEWREPKLIILLEIDKQGRMTKESRPWIDGTFSGPDAVLELVAFHLHRLGAAAAEAVVFVADGAPWIWDRLEWVEKRVGVAAGKVSHVLDWCHAVHNVSLALEPLHLPEKEKRKLFSKLRRWLRRGWTGLVVNTLQELGEQRDWPEGMDQPLGYLTKHAEAGHLAYARYRQQGLPMGSGAIESAIRRVINLRLNGPGLHWKGENAEGALVLRAAAVSGRWEETMEKARAGIGKERTLDWDWEAPDMVEALKAEEVIEPPVFQQAAAYYLGMKTAH
jgi:hypothetical protein